MVKLSAREEAAKKAGVAVNYKAPASKQIQPIKPAPIAKPLLSKTPAVKLATAQKAQPIYGPAKPKVYGPAAPAQVLYNNAKKQYDEAKKSIETGLKLHSTVNRVAEIGRKQINAKQAADEAKIATEEADKANKQGDVLTNLKGIGKNLNKSTIKSGIKTGIEKITDIARFAPQAAMTAYQSAKQGITGKKQEYTAKSVPSIALFGDKPILSVQRRTERGIKMAKDYAKEKGKELSSGQSALAGGALAIGSIAADFTGIGKSTRGFLKGGEDLAKRVFKGTAEAEAKKAAFNASRAITPGQVKNASEAVASNFRTNTARAAEFPETAAKVAEDIPANKISAEDRALAESRIPESERGKVPTKPNERVDVENARKAVSEERANVQRAVDKAREDLSKRSPDEFGNVDDSDIRKALDEAHNGSKERSKRLYKEITGEDAPDDLDQIAKNLDEYRMNNERRFQGQDAERMSSKEKSDSRNFGRPLKESISQPGLLRRGRGFGSGKGRAKGVLSKKASVEETKRIASELRKKNPNMDVVDQGFLIGLGEKSKHTPDELRQLNKIVERENAIGARKIGQREQTDFYHKLAGNKTYDQFKEAFPKGTDEQTIKDLYIQGKKKARGQRSFSSPTVGETVPATQGKLNVSPSNGKVGMLRGEAPPIKKPSGKSPFNGQLAAHGVGAGAGIETDENGNIHYNAEKGLLGLGAGALGIKAVGKLGQKGLLTAARESKGFNPSTYVKEMTASRNAARNEGGMFSGVKNFLNEVKKKVIEVNAPIENVIRDAQKKYNFESIPRYDMTDAIDRVYKAPTIAAQFSKDNGLIDVIKKVENVDEFDQYLIAKHGIELSNQGIETGRDLAKDKMLVEALGSKYAKEEKAVRDYSHALLDRAVEDGLVSKETAKMLKEKYPDYVPYNRVFGEDELTTGTGKKGVANLGKQTVVQRIKGSEREVESPLESFLGKTGDAILQGEKNKAAKILTSFHNLPDNPFGLEKIIGTKNPGDNTISFFNNGVKEVWKVNKDVAEAAKALNVQQMGILGKIFAAPIRVARLGITGLNLPFVAANISRDLVSAFVQSKNGMRSLTTFPQALFQAIGHGKIYDEMVRNGAIQTSFDISRNQISPTMRNVRGLLRNKGMDRVKYVASSPAKLVRAVENIIGRSEELNRINQYKAAYDSAIKKGMQPIDARAVASRAARETTVNFARHGEYGQVMNALVLYLNAGIQGSRTLLRAIKTRPVATSAKIATTVAMPMAITTAWNMSDPKRRAAYEDISEFEKENNFIFIPNNPTKDENGKWNVVKVPIQPGLSNMVQPVRYAIERSNEFSPQTFAEIASQITGAISPVNIPFDKETSKKTVSQLMPQVIKPTAEAVAGKDFFTGANIIPRKLEGLAPHLQVKEGTSGTAKQLGLQLGVSPLQVEHFIKSTFGGLGIQALNASDQVLAKTGKISPQEIGGQNVFDAVFARFGKAAGGALEDRQYKADAQANMEAKSEKYVAKRDFMPTYNQVQDLVNSGKEDEAQAAVEAMSDSDYEQYKNIKKSERAKSSATFHEALRSNPKQAVKYLNSQPQSEQQRLLDNMNDDEYLRYETGKLK